MFVVATLVAIAALGVGVAVGMWFAGRRQRASDRSPRHAAREAGGQPVRGELARFAMDALNQGVVVLDRDEQAVLVNPAARVMGILSKDRLAFPELSTLVRRVLVSGVEVRESIDLPVGRLGREPTALAVTAVPLVPGPGERVAGVGLLLADETDQRRLEAVRRDFVANVSHELKTPVGALTLLAEAIQDAADDPEAVARFAGRIHQEGSRLARLVGELMELSRVQGADPMPGAVEVDVDRIVQEAVQRTQLAAEQAEITISAVCGPDLQIRGNQAQLATALANLVDNAIAYSGSGTKVAVSARPATDEDGRPVVDIAVTDQGIGIAEADRDRIFERFYRVDPARSRATGGTGLGLAIVKNIVNNHSGSVRVWSSLGSGSTFTVRLPRVHADKPRSEPTSQPGSAEPADVASVGSAKGPQVR